MHKSKAELMTTRGEVGREGDEVNEECEPLRFMLGDDVLLLYSLSLMYCVAAT